MNTELLMQNLQLSLTVTIVGMVIVMVFLTLMVFTTDITKKIVDWLNVKFPVEVPVDTKQQKKQSGAEEEIAVAIASVLAYQHKA
ncbi:TPA: OadG family protein [Candidatus Galligastranaerophilus intestinigallinarum]|nr:OadG family protein [Candidatus Galligastranaerophilus intestinigallinarum]